jgi:adenylyl-sulfate kinase
MTLTPHIQLQAHALEKKDRAQMKRQRPCVLWFTGLSGSGKSTTANAVEKKLFELGYHTYLLDGDNVRHGLNKDLGFSPEDRAENIRRIGEVAKLFTDAGLIVLTAFISPYREDRRMVRELIGDDAFMEIFMGSPLRICEERDPKGLYKKARQGNIQDFTGVQSQYESPLSPDLVVDAGACSPEACAEKVVDFFLKFSKRLQ